MESKERKGFDPEMTDNGQTLFPETAKEPGKIDLIRLIFDMMKGIRFLWWLPILLFILTAGYFYHTYDFSYEPVYETSATVYVSMSKKENTYMDELSAEQMLVVFPYLMENGVLPDAIRSYLGQDSYEGSIRAYVDANTNLMTFVVSGSDPLAIHDTLDAVIEVVPDTLSFIVGKTTFMKFKDMGISTEPINKRPSKLTAIRYSAKRGLYGFALGFMLMLLYGLTIRTVSFRDEIKEKFNVPFLGSLPHLKVKKQSSRKRSKLTIDNDRASYRLGESIRMIRNRFEREALQKGVKTLLVTSSIPGEGKTTIAVNLALSLSMKGKKVLLIDGDLRNPSVSDLLDLKEGSAGLSEVLKEEAQVSDAIIHLSETDLYVLAAGNPTRKSADLLSGERMGALLSELKDYVDYIIIDTPPLMVLGDCMALGRFVDGCIYVVRRNHAYMPVIKDGFLQAAESGVRMMCTVFNDDNEGLGEGYSRYGRYGKYGRYSSYGYYGKRKRYGYYGAQEKE